MTPPARTARRRPDDRPDEILDAALAVFAERGFSATRIEDIAEGAALSKGAVYLYFPSKEAIFEAIVRRFSNRFAAAITGQIRQFARIDAEDGLRSSIKAILTLMEDPAASATPKLVLSEAQRFPDVARLYRREVIDRARAAIEALIRAGMAQGRFRQDLDPDIAFKAIVGPMIIQLLLGQVFTDPSDQKTDSQAMGDALSDILLGGLRSQEAAT